ncbi:hypothetical protein JZ751_023514 [Albula glossodonta]|uniref:Uncharacterized protein n=1 Tax=Albula glossodonta TaxID=121402 RepID=A0A8T2NGA1_9TELE|nr:hypothetical protein JZ751_023514 [Albula glossodonta]
MWNRFHVPSLADTEDASETDLAKHDEDDYVEIKEQMYQDKLASLKRQLLQLQEDLFLQLEVS